MTSLRVGSAEVARYDWDHETPRTAVPRPALHPLWTLRGTQVSAEHPADHPWHRGLGVALPDVDGVNLWGGPTYQAGHGYRDTELGRLRQESPRECRPNGIRLGSPGSNGRSGAGYGGFFWRLPSVDRVTVFTADAEGEDAVSGTSAPWLAISVGEVCTAVLIPADERTAADPWFVRVRDYIGIGSALAWNRPIVLPAGTSLRIALRVLLMDRICDPPTVSAIVAGLNGNPQ
jgi:hypothetical protein